MPLRLRTRVRVDTCPRSGPRKPLGPAPPRLFSRSPVSSTVHRQSSSLNVQTCPRSNVQTLQSPPFVPHLTAFVPQTTNVEDPPITRNIPRIPALKWQESYLFLERNFLNFLYSKITDHGASSTPSPVSHRPPSIVRGPIQPSNLPTFKHPNDLTFPRQSAIKNRQSPHLFLPKVNSKNNSKQFLDPPHIRHSTAAPPHIRLHARQLAELNAICFELFRIN